MPFVPTSKRKAKREKLARELRLTEHRRRGFEVVKPNGDHYVISPAQWRSGKLVLDDPSDDALPWVVCRETSGPCPAQEALANLHSGGKLPNFAARFRGTRSDGLGNCHDVVLALLEDLLREGEAEGWEWLVGMVHFKNTGDIEHSWLEFDGWALDASDSRGGMILFMEDHAYRKQYSARVSVARDAQESATWLRAFSEGRVRKPQEPTPDAARRE